MPKMIRQGDVLLIRVEPLPSSTTKITAENGRLILARGEATGHHHSVSDTDAELIQIGGRMLLAVERQTALEHQEHAPLTLETGVYEVRRQREFAGFGTDWRPVRD